MKITVRQAEEMTSRPLPIVASYAGSKQIVTINLGVERLEKSSRAAATPEGEADADAYTCTTLSFSTGGRITAEDVVKQLVKNNFFDAIDTDFLKGFAEWFAIPDYDTLAAVLVSGRYTYAEELACHRKALLGDRQPLEELSAYVEQCKALARPCFASE